MSDADRRNPTTPDRRHMLPRAGGRRETDRPGFQCPFCQHPRTRVCDSVPRPNRRGYRRRRYCVACRKKFWTFEAVDAA